MSVDEIFDQVYLKCIAYTGATYDSREVQFRKATELLNMLLRNFPNKYANEIVGAYYLADKGKLFDDEGKQIKLFRMFDYRQCSDLINAFDMNFNDEFVLLSRSQKFYYEPEEEKPKITFKELDDSFRTQFIKAVEIYKENGNYDLAGSTLFLYDILKRKGYCDFPIQEKEDILEAAKNSVKAQLLKEKQSGHISYGRRIELGAIIEAITPKDVAVINKAREIILNLILENITEEKVNEILNKQYQ